MLSQARWEAECILMSHVFPHFVPFSDSGIIGFYGALRGPRSRRVYQVWIQANPHEYPQLEPAVYLNPHPEWHHWIPDRIAGGRLCYQREERQWSPARDTFLKTLLVALDYVREFD